MKIMVTDEGDKNGTTKTESVLSRFLKGVVIALGFILPGSPVEF